MLKDIDKAIEIKYFLTGRNIKGSDGYDVEMKISSKIHMVEEREVVGRATM